jgi:hypothetical protein
MQDDASIAYCGLFCGDCIIRTGGLASLSAELLQRLRSPEFQKLARGLPVLHPEFTDLRDYERCCDVLATIADHLRCEGTCREGGGSTGCEIRRCCQEHGFRGCWACAECETCDTLAWLEPVHGDAHLRNLRRLRTFGVRAFLAGEKHR